MSPHPDTEYDLQTHRYQELLTEAARVRRTDTLVGQHPQFDQTDRLHVFAGRVRAWIGTTTSAARFSRRPARSWS